MKEYELDEVYVSFPPLQMSETICSVEVHVGLTLALDCAFINTFLKKFL